MDFAFRSKKSHNGWLAFMYPRLLFARYLLSKDGVIFISIDDNEHANLKLLCDEIFGEENFVGNLIWKKKGGAGNTEKILGNITEYLVCYAKRQIAGIFNYRTIDREYKFTDSIGQYNLESIEKTNEGTYERKTMQFAIIDPKTNEKFYPQKGKRWTIGEVKSKEYIQQRKLLFDYTNHTIKRIKRPDDYELSENVFLNLLLEHGSLAVAKDELLELIQGREIFDTPKPLALLKHLLQIATNSNDIILDFFAGSGTTGHAVMQLNAEDGGNRKFILCQIDEPINKKKKKEAYDFCVENKLPPVISSITIERLRRAGEKIEKENNGTIPELKKAIPDVGFKVFDLADAPKLELENEQIVFKNTGADPLSRIYNMLFSIGIDDPNSKLECIVNDCMYKIGEHYYITNAEELDKTENKKYLQNAIKNGKIFIDGWTASINTTLQNYKEDVKIVF
jgi:adenine-specific DNA-methyltransferase